MSVENRLNEGVKNTNMRKKTIDGIKGFNKKNKIVLNIVTLKPRSKDNQKKHNSIKMYIIS